MSNTSLKAVLDDELAEFLESIGILGDIQSGNMKCKFCEVVVTLENFRAVFPDSGNIAVVCSKPECSHLLSEYIRKNEEVSL